jgi:xylulokinase
LLLSIDVGTTAIKAGCFTPEGKMLGMSYAEYPLLHPAPYHVEQDASLWWSLSTSLVGEALGSAGCSPADVAALGVSAQGISYVPIDPQGLPLRNAFSWLDTRAVEQANRLRELFPDRAQAFKRLGLHPVPTYTLPKIMWLKDNQPEIFEAAHKFSTCLDFMNGRLAGRFVTDYSIAGGTLAHDLAERDWAKDVLNAVGVPCDKLPSIEWSGTLLGSIRPEAAREMNLPDTVQIVLGGHDQECAALGAGMQDGELTISLGTASILIAPLDAPIFDPGLRIPCYPHVERDQFVLEAVVSAAGVSFRWLRDLFSTIAALNDAEPFSYDALVELARQSPPGSSGVSFYPHLSGATSPFWVPQARGVFHGISLATSAADIARAVLEGWCFQLKSNLVVIEQLTTRRKNILAFGGGTRSPFIRQLLADVLGRPVLISPTSETALLGAAMLAGYGAGIYASLDEAKAVVREGAIRCQPQAGIVDIYAEVYARYREVEDQLLQMEQRNGEF